CPRLMSSPLGELSQLRPEAPLRRRRRWPRIGVAIWVPGLAAAGAVWSRRSTGSPEEVADAYLSAWEGGAYAEMRELVADPPADFERIHRRFLADLKAERIALERHVPTGVFSAIGPTTRSVHHHAAVEGPDDFLHDADLKFDQ